MAARRRTTSVRRRATILGGLIIAGAGLLTAGTVEAQLAYYPYPCPLVSGGRDFNGNGEESASVFDPRTGGLGPLAWGTYGDLPFSVDLDSDGDGDFVVYRPSAGIWYGHGPAFTIPWGLPGDIPIPRSTEPALAVYRPQNQVVYWCRNPSAAGCGDTTTSGPTGSVGAVPIPGGTR